MHSHQKKNPDFSSYIAPPGYLYLVFIEVLCSKLPSMDP